MSTPQLFLLLLLHFILFIPTSITLHSGKADFKPMLKTKYKKNLSSLFLVFFCVEWRSLHAAHTRMKRPMCCSLLCEVSDCVAYRAVAPLTRPPRRLVVVVTDLWRYLFFWRRLFLCSITVLSLWPYALVCFEAKHHYTITPSAWRSGEVCVEPCGTRGPVGQRFPNWTLFFMLKIKYQISSRCNKSKHSEIKTLSGLLHFSHDRSTPPTLGTTALGHLVKKKTLPLPVTDVIKQT